MIHIIDDFYVTANEGEFILKEKTLSTAEKDGKKYKKGETYEGYVIKGYFQKMSSVVIDVINILTRRKVQENKIRSLTTYSKACADLEKRILERCKLLDVNLE